MILVTGATGFIGKNLIPPLANLHRLRLLVRKTSNIKPFLGLKNIEFAYGDFATNQGIKEALNNISLVIHLAARTIGKNYYQYYQTNTNATKYLIRVMQAKKVNRILFLSTLAVAGPCPSPQQPWTEAESPRPVSFYGITKKYAEEIIISSGLNYIILRPGAVYGPYDTEVLKYVKLINHGLFPLIGGKNKYQSMIYVKDLVSIIIDMINRHKYNKEIYFVSDGNFYSYDEISKELSILLKKKVIKFSLPQGLARCCALFYDLFLPEKKRLIWQDKVKELCQNYWLCSYEKLAHTCKFKPRYNLKQGMQETIAWYKKKHLL